ncbi:MAG: hypothetical protein E7483_03905 [Ruminococcaceae bacterium]|nr:hypothetical protein [Oscillospiraceae bacterium]
MIKVKEKSSLKYNSALLYLVSFAVPIAVMMAAYLCNGIFTQWSILINDLSSQYSAFLLYYRNSMLENGIFYSFSKALGGNFFGIFTYYLTSPLNLLVFLFPSDRIEIPIAVMILLRFGLASMAFSWFVQKVKPNCSKLMATAFGVVYALSSYMVVLSYHLLWGDVYFMLPIIAGFLLDIFDGKSCLNFVIAFSFMIISNYYMAYMVGIFCALMFVHNCIKIADAKQAVKTFFALARAAAVSVGLTAWLLVPTVFALLQGKFTIPDERIFAFGFGDLIYKMFIGSYDSVGNISAPFIYCGSAALVLFFAKWFVNKVSAKEKIADLFVAAVLVLSCWFVPLNKVWHMFAAPNAFPYRFTYILVFFALWKAFEGCCEIETKTERRNFASFAGAVLILVCVLAVKFTAVSRIKIAFTFIIAAAVVLLVLIYKICDKNIFVLLMALVMVGDMALNAYLLVGKNYEMLAKQPADNFARQYNIVADQLATIEEDGFYRIFNIKNQFEDVDYTENTVFQHGYNEMYRAFTSLTENEFESFKENVLRPVDNDVLVSMLGAKYTLKHQVVQKVETAVFPLICKTINKPQSYSYDVGQYIVDATGINVFMADGSVDYNALNAAGLIAQANGAQNIVQQRNKITASINSDTDNQFVAASVIFDDGWTIKVNGQKVTKHRMLNNLMGFYVHSGDNTIEMIYTPKGFYPSLAVSLFTLLCCVWYYVVENRKKAGR